MRLLLEGRADPNTRVYRPRGADEMLEACQFIDRVVFLQSNSMRSQQMLAPTKQRA
jgi:hypothetical protein